MGFAEFLTIIFILLKVFGVISWSWWLVWLPEIIAGVFYIILLSSPFWIDSVIGKHFEKKNKKRMKLKKEEQK